MHAEPPSTARLTERLSEQLYENTPGEKYATLFCSLYDEHSGRGDLLAIFSDGVTEAENAVGEQFEASRLSDLLRPHTRLPLDDLIKMVTDHLTRWIHDPETRDDITIVLARKWPAPE